MNDNNSLSHTSWNCKYHIVFAPKYRRAAIYGKIRTDIGKILRLLCERKGIEIIEAEMCKDHVHMLVQIPPKYSVSQIVGYLISNDIGYIPDFDDDRNKMATLDRTLILENMISEYLK